MNWIRTWKNQYGSMIQIVSQQNGKRVGTFESAVDQTTKGQQLALIGFCNDHLLAISCSGGDHVVTYASMFYQGRLETAWQLVSSYVIGAAKEGEPAVKTPLAWWQSVKTNVDTFDKVIS